MPQNYLVTPFGFLHPTCVMEIRENEAYNYGLSQIEEQGVRTRAVPPCERPGFDKEGRTIERRAAAVPTINGWVADAFTNAWQPLWWLEDNWTVPSNPVSISGQTVYLFPGFEPDSGENIVQPVLGFNAFLDNRWTISSWFVHSNGTALHTTPVVVPLLSHPLI